MNSKSSEKNKKKRLKMKTSIFNPSLRTLRITVTNLQVQELISTTDSDNGKKERNIFLEQISQVFRAQKVDLIQKSLLRKLLKISSVGGPETLH